MDEMRPRRTQVLPDRLGRQHGLWPDLQRSFMSDQTHPSMQHAQTASYNLTQYTKGR
jgi:hypothetical protein